MEMSSETLIMRMMASLGDIPFQKLRTGQLNEADWKRSSVVNSLLSGLTQNLINERVIFVQSV